MSAPHTSRAPLGPPVAVSLQMLPGAERDAIETFVAERFARAYGATLRQFLPWFLVLREPAGSLAGVVGLRPAGPCPRLFLETYLDQPIEDLLAAQVGHPVARPRLMEVGNLAASSPGGARWLISGLTAFLDGAGYEYAVFTATAALRHAFAHLGIKLLDLAPASAERLGPAVAHWGTYYQTQPRVVAAPVSVARDALLVRPGHLEGFAQAWIQAQRAGVRSRAEQAEVQP